MKSQKSLLRPSSFHFTVPRGAFTLLELLIAVGLTSMLMIALFSALQTYFDLQLDSHDEITRQQISRTLLRQMTRDIQSVVFVRKSVTDEEDSSAGTGSGTSSGTASSGGSTVGNSSAGTTSGGSSSASSSLDGNSYGQSSIDPETVMSTYTNGLVGTNRDLQLFVSRPERSLSYVSAQELSSTTQRTSDLILIRYLLADSGSGGLGSAIADREAFGNASGTVGLARLEGDLYGLSTASESSEELPQVTAAKLIAKEVANIEFRYFDGLNWQESWDSNALNEMPKAVEILLTLRNSEADDQSDTDEQDAFAIPETIHRMVVPIPVAEPFVTESAL